MYTGNIGQLQKEISSLITAIDTDAISTFSQAICGAAQTKHMIYILGNGGSASLATHMATDLFQVAQKISGEHFLSATALTANSSLLTALANDYGYEDIFARQLRPVLSESDIVFAISISGKSPNVLHALALAKQRGAIRLGLTGERGTPMRDLCNYCTVVASKHPFVIETVHLAVAHLILAAATSQLIGGDMQ